MKRNKEVLEKIKKSLGLLSIHVNRWVKDMYCDDVEDTVVVVLNVDANKEQFCSLLYGSGLFHPNDNVTVIF